MAPKIPGELVAITVREFQFIEINLNAYVFHLCLMLLDVYIYI